MNVIYLCVATTVKSSLRIGEIKHGHCPLQKGCEKCRETVDRPNAWRVSMSKKTRDEVRKEGEGTYVMTARYCDARNSRPTLHLAPYNLVKSFGASSPPYVALGATRRSSPVSRTSTAASSPLSAQFYPAAQYSIPNAICSGPHHSCPCWRRRRLQ